LQLALYRLDHLRVTVAGVEHGDAAGKVDVLAPFHIPDGRVLGALDEDRVDLPHTTGYGLLTPLHEGFVAVCHVTAPLPSDTAKTQVFYFQVLIDAVLRPFAAQPGGLHAAKGRHFGGNQAGVDPDHAVLQRLGHPEHAAQTAGIEIGGQATFSLAGLGNRIGLAL